jgi:hypothetical protein
MPLKPLAMSWPRSSCWTARTRSACSPRWRISLVVTGLLVLVFSSLMRTSRRGSAALPLVAANVDLRLPPGCREPSGLLPTRQWFPRTGLTLRSRASRRRHGVPGSSSPAVPLACQSQRPDRS